MPPVNDADRHALSRARRHMRLARQWLPEPRRGHMHSLLASFIRSIDEEIGPEEQPTRDLNAELPDGWHVEPGEAGRVETPKGRAALLNLLRTAALDPESLTPREKAGLRSAFASEHPKADPLPDERSLAHVAEPRDHERERQLAIDRIASEDDEP